MLLRIGSRSSPLAIAQTEEAIALIKAVDPSIECKIVAVQTIGDINNAPFHQINRRDIFTKEIEDLLLQGRIDIAVHSMKDLPVMDENDLYLAAAIAPNDCRDCLVSKNNYTSIVDLPPFSKVGTSASRRKAQILHIRPDLVIEDIRGNIVTRIGKMYNSDLDAIILASAGLNRLNIPLAECVPESDVLYRDINRACAYVIDIAEMLPCAGQGMLALQIHKGDKRIASIIEKVNNREAWIRAQTERSFLCNMGVSCGDPVAALAVVRSTDESMYTIDASFMILSHDGTKCHTSRHTGKDYLQIAAAGAADLEQFRWIWKSK